jgi:site-specific recombinase XerD
MKISNFTKLFERDMRYKNYSASTIKNYVCQIELFLKKFMDKDSPKHISSSEIKDYILTSNEVNSQRHMHSAIKLFYKLTVHQPNKFRHIQYARKNKKLPQVIDRQFLLDRISKIENLKHKAIISLAFSVGLRVSEVINLKITDVDSDRMLITIRQAKGNKDRLVPLSPTILKLLRSYFKLYKPMEYLFNGQFSRQYSKESCNKIVKKYLGSQYHFHTLRHSSFTSMVELGTNMRLIQEISGHSSGRTLDIYTHISPKILNSAHIPL